MDSFFEYLKSTPAASLPKKIATHVLPSLTASLRRHGFRDIDNTALRFWALDMFLSGNKFATVNRYIAALHKLYIATGERTADPFVDVLATISPAMECDVKTLAQDKTALRRLIRRLSTGQTSVATAIFLYLLYTPTATLDDAINLRHDNIEEHCSQIDDIIAALPRAKEAQYVFPLHILRAYTPGTIRRRILDDMRAALGAEGLQVPDVPTTGYINALWTSFALDADVPVALVGGIFGTLPEQFKALELIPAADLDQGSKLTIISRVADRINDITSRWHILRLRPGTTPEHLLDTIGRYDSTLQQRLITYYPTRQTLRIARNGRRVSEATPYIPGILFIKLRSDHMARLMTAISPLAWCYKTANTPDAPYATISPAQMTAFQRHIGAFTPDIELQLVERTTPFAPDTRVRITGGIMDGRIGTIDTITTTDGQRHYSLKITESLHLTWKINQIPETLLEKA